MKWSKSFVVLGLLAGLTMSEVASARGGHGGFHGGGFRGRVGVGVVIGAPLIGAGLYYGSPYYGGYGSPYYGGYYGGYSPYYSPYYYPPSYYYPQVGVAAAPPVYVEQGAGAAPAVAPQQSNFWYYCRNPEGYYPYVKECAAGWQQVSPQPAR